MSCGSKVLVTSSQDAHESLSIFSVNLLFLALESAVIFVTGGVDISFRAFLWLGMERPEREMRNKLSWTNVRFLDPQFHEVDIVNSGNNVRE